MRVIPAIDLKGGVVVRGVGGRRAEYRPLVSCLADDASPRAVARGLRRRGGWTEAYVADLDALAGAPPAWKDYEAIAGEGLSLWIDAGASSARRVEEMLDWAAGCPAASLAAVIVALEALDGVAALREIVDRCGRAPLAFSLDLLAGRLLGRTALWPDPSPAAVAREVLGLGISRLIVLDLAAVGGNAGPTTLALCRKLRRAAPQIELIGGGGVRGQEDLDRLARAGCNAALVATALHEGRLPFPGADAPPAVTG